MSIFPEYLTVSGGGWWSEYSQIAAGRTEYPITLYSQRDERWRNEVYSGGVTFGSAGCYVTSVAMVLSLAGYTDEPPDVAERMRTVGCFSGAYLTSPERIPVAYPKMQYDGTLQWHEVAADMERLRSEMALSPVIIEVDFVHATQEFNQHFAVALEERDGDILIADPWDGTITKLLQRYAGESWSLGRAVYGARLLRAK